MSIGLGGLIPKLSCSYRRILNVRVVKASQSLNQIQSGAGEQESSSRRKRRPQNLPGEFFVDHTCIDCDTCRWMAPEVFTRVGDMSAVVKQPSCQEERLKALQALLSCPTSSIHTEIPAPDILEVQKTFPLPINEQNVPVAQLPGVSYNSPRYSERLADNFERMGGVRYMFLTHKDDVADHGKWSKRLNCDRILHSEEVNSSTADVEIKLEGSGPWSLGDEIALIHTPGHSEGSVCLFYKPLKVLFTGDHLAMDESGLTIGERYNFYSVPKQLDSVRMLLELDFVWILPGHGRSAEYMDVEEKNASLDAFLASKLHLA